MNIGEYMTIKTIEALNRAVEIQKANGNPEITSAHLFRAMLESDSVVGLIFGRLNLDINSIKNEVDKIIEKYPKSTGSGAYMSQSLSDVLANADSKRADFKDSYLSLEHILLAMIDEPGELKNIFKKFYRVKNQFNQGGSVGLGLAFCKEITEFMGGEIKVSSVKGEGTTFTLVFPK